jgi:hypothetical protein
LLVEELESRTLPSLLAPVSYPVGAYPEAVAVGDFTGSGIPDLVVANHQSGTVSVLLGKGDGTFGPAQNFAVGGTPVSVAVGDFNNDGKLDLVTANDNNGSVSVLLGNGDGTFQPALNYVLPAQPPGTQTPLSVAVGDFNKDGKLDLAVTAYTYRPGYWEPFGYYGQLYVPPERDAYVNVLIGNGAGGFSADNSYALPDNSPLYAPSRAIAVGDFNGNGQLDLAVADGTGSTLSLLLGNGDGTFVNPTPLATGSHPLSVAVGDFNGDKKLDLVTANVNDNSVSVLLGNGNGTFAPAVNYSVGIGPITVPADLNRDGKLDIVTANLGGNSVSVLLGQGDGTFQTAQNFAPGSAFADVAVDDFNGDGWPDLAIANPSANTVSVLLNAADWSTARQASSFVVSGFPSLTAAGAPGSFTVTARYADGTTATNYTGTVHFTSTDPQAFLPADYTFSAADAGVHTFSATLKTAGTQSITATDTSTAINGTETGIAVNPAAASTLGVTGFPSPVPAGWAGDVFVTTRDPYGNIATGYRGTIRFTSTDGKASLPANYTFTAADAGIRPFSATLVTAGMQAITATDTTTAGITGTDAGIAVSPAAASKFIITAPSKVTAGSRFSLTIMVEDAYGNVVTGYTGTVHLSSTDNTATLPKNYTFSAADRGVHTFTGLVLRKKGSQQVTVTDTLNSSLNAGKTMYVAWWIPWVWFWRS